MAVYRKFIKDGTLQLVGDCGQVVPLSDIRYIVDSYYNKGRTVTTVKTHGYNLDIVYYDVVNGKITV